MNDILRDIAEDRFDAGVRLCEQVAKEMIYARPRTSHDRAQNGGPASFTGLRSGDVVRRFAVKTVSDSREFARLVADASPGPTVSVTLLRAG